MKKLVFMFVAVAAISFASCGNQVQQAEAETDTLEALLDSILADSVAADTVVADTVAVAE